MINARNCPRQARTALRTRRRAADPPVHILGSLLAKERNSRKRAPRSTAVPGSRADASGHAAFAGHASDDARRPRALAQCRDALALGEAEQRCRKRNPQPRADASIRGSIHVERGRRRNSPKRIREALRLRCRRQEPRNSLSWFVQAQIGDCIDLAGTLRRGASPAAGRPPKNMRALLGAGRVPETLDHHAPRRCIRHAGDWKNSALRRGKRFASSRRLTPRPPEPIPVEPKPGGSLDTTAGRTRKEATRVPTP